MRFRPSQQIMLFQKHHFSAMFVVNIVQQKIHASTPHQNMRDSDLELKTEKRHTPRMYDIEQKQVPSKKCSGTPICPSTPYPGALKRAKKWL